MKVFIAPTYRKSDNADGGIRRVSEALWKYLPQFDIEPTDNPAEAGLFNLHGASLVERPGVPIVASMHGLYWDDYKFAKWADETNRQVTAVMSRAKAITAPSQWVANAITRGMLVTPHVIYHGVDAGEWEHSETPDTYVLWNKARNDAVSNSDDMQTLAALMKGQKFVSTLGNQTNNIHITGIMPIEAMRPIVQRAGVYLATARETFGIATLEAMAAGVPVAGWDYGGQREIVLPGETGYLAPYGDYHALAECVSRCLAERVRLSENCREDVRKRWGWVDKIERYAQVFHEVWNGERATRPKVSVVVLSHNLGRYLPDALNSVVSQTSIDWECIIVDDYSDDNTREVAMDYAARDSRFTYHRTPENLKLSGARNFGASFATGKYLIFLDADDMFDAQALELLSNALDRDNTIHIASGHLDTINGENMERSRGGGWPPSQFDYHAQMCHLNQLHYSAMWRREVFEAVGGYRRRSWRAEDAEAWIRVSSFGYRIQKVTEQSTLVYRFRSDSKSQQEMKAHPDRDGDWTAWYPWRIAGNPQDGLKLWKRGTKTPPTLTPWGAQGNPPEGVKFWPVKHHASPLVSVIIPCGPGHERYVIDAVESVMAQTFTDWEVIVVNDTGREWGEGLDNPLAGAPYVRLVHGPQRGPGAARNAGAAIARGQAFVFGDADDYLWPQFLEWCVGEWKKSGRGVYTDYFVNVGRPGESLEQWETFDWECSRYVQTGSGEELVGTLLQLKHANCYLLPADKFRECGGYDENCPAHEDHDLQIALEATGLCFVRIPVGGFFYRVKTGDRRIESKKNWESAKHWFHKKWEAYYTGEKEMPCGHCPGGVAQELLTLPTPQSEELPPEDALLLEYLGNADKFTIQMEGMSAAYVFGKSDTHRKKYVRTRDAQMLLDIVRYGKHEYQRVDRPRPQAPSPLNVIPGKPPTQPLPDMSEFIRKTNEVRL